MKKSRWKTRQEMKNELVNSIHRYHNHRIIVFDSVGFLLGLLSFLALVLPMKLFGWRGLIVSLCFFAALYFALPKFEERLARWAGVTVQE